MSQTYKSDCKHFRGDVPCKPHKITGIHCVECSEFFPQNQRILIIKLGAIGDVIRTTPLLHKLWREFPSASIWWLTNSPEILPSRIDKILPFNLESITTLNAIEFDIVINFDKDLHACSLASNLKTKKIIGFTLSDGKPAPANPESEQKFLTGLWDDVNKANDKSYVDEIFEICGFEFKGEEYILEMDDSYSWELPARNKMYVGLNTGCGSRWTSRLWKFEYWEQLINLLISKGYTPILLGGEQEHEKNKLLSEKTGSFYPGYFDLKKFISLINHCDTVVTAVTMGLHIAIGLKKNVVLFNNIFNPKEFELYGRGVILEPELECKCFFKPQCTNIEYFCLDHLLPENVMKAIEQIE
ncbi:MAG: glycosyl transferase family 9 [Ignavibacteria bacterium]|nr:glycosyl transferase family 9 [Ignavibacteria bacterium]